MLVNAAHTRASGVEWLCACRSGRTAEPKVSRDVHVHVRAAQPSWRHPVPAAPACYMYAHEQEMSTTRSRDGVSRAQN